MRHSIVKLFVFITLAASANTNAAPARKLLGWQLDPYFVEVGEGRDAPDISHDFYPKGESPNKWTERILLRSRAITLAATPASVLDQLFAEFRTHCPGLSERRIDVSAADAKTLGLTMWHCPSDAATARGIVATQKVVVNGPYAYVMTAEGNYASFNESTTPLTPAQLGRWGATQRSLVVCDDLTLPGCLPAPTALMTAVEIAPDAREAQAINQAEARGMQLYLQDQLAWHATDYLSANGGLKRSKDGGFVAIPDVGRSGRVYFVRRAGGKIKGTTEVQVDSDGKPTSSTEMQQLPDAIVAREAALHVAKATALQVCESTVNSAVLPAEDGDGWWVYIMTGTTRPNLMYLGGHNRIRIDHAGRVVSTEPSAKSCLALDMAEKGPNGEPLAALMAVHWVSETPWETHVFQSLNFKQQLIVVTRTAVWRVSEGHIRKLDL